jgi:CubicO group peptidase (beta-lactamase class C family)
MLLNGGELDGVRILGRKTVELMTASHTGNIFIPMLGHGFGFGMGVGVHTGGRWAPRIRSVGAYGWGGAAGTTYFADPKEGLLAVCFTQVLTHLMMPENTYQEEFERLVYQALL